MSAWIRLKEASGQLGITSRSIKEWIKSGKLNSSLINNQVMISQADIDEITNEARSPGGLIVAQPGQRRQLRIVSKFAGYDVPEKFHLIKRYEELTEYTLGFANNLIPFLLLVGPAGAGKSRQVDYDLRGKGVLWIDSQASNMGLYSAVYRAAGCPVVLDHMNHFLTDKIGRNLVKGFTQTEETKAVSWESTSSQLQKENVARRYFTKSKFCMIANSWDRTNADMAAIQDRAMPVAFFPDAETIHNRVIELGWCKDKDVIDFIGDNLGIISEPSQRNYFNGSNFKRLGPDWKNKLLAIWGVK